MDKILNVTAVESAIYRADKVSREVNSKGEAVTWYRLAEEIKGNAVHITTSKDNREFAALRPVVDVAAFGRFIAENASLSNVADWVTSIFDATNRKILQTAGAGGAASVGLMGDAESLIAFETLESARGRRASRLNSDQWKLIAPIFGAQLVRYYVGVKNMESEKAKNVAARMLNFMKAALSTSAPFTDVKLVEAMLQFIAWSFDAIVAAQPEAESLLAFSLVILESHKQAAADIDPDIY